MPQRFQDMYRSTGTKPLPLPVHRSAPTNAPNVSFYSCASINGRSDVGGPGCDDPELNKANGGVCHYVEPNSSSPLAIPDDQARIIRAGYAGAVTFVDGQVGKVLDQLEALGHRDDTVVAFWADHGWALGEHAVWCKQDNYELETRVPMILRVPWMVHGSGGGSTTALVELVDMFPTLLDLAGLLNSAAVPDVHQLEGISLLPVLADPELHLRGAGGSSAGSGAAASWRNASFSQYPKCMNSTMRLKPPYMGNGDPCTGVPSNQFTHMGYTMRTSKWRYTEWPRWVCTVTDVCTNPLDWGHVDGVGDSTNTSIGPSLRMTHDAEKKVLCLAPGGGGGGGGG